MMKSYHEKQMYVHLMEPVIKWITRCIFNHADQETIIQLLRDFRVQPNEWKPTQSIHLFFVFLHFLLKWKMLRWMFVEAENVEPIIAYQ